MGAEVRNWRLAKTRRATSSVTNCAGKAEQPTGQVPTLPPWRDGEARRDRDTARGDRGNVRPSATPRSEANEQAECARERERGKRLSDQSANQAIPCGIFQRKLLVQRDIRDRPSQKLQSLAYDTQPNGRIQRHGGNYLEVIWVS